MIEISHHIIEFKVRSLKDAKKLFHFSKHHKSKTGFAILFNFAVSDKSGVVKIYGHRNTGTLNPEGLTQNWIDAAISVNMTTIDAMVKEDRVFVFKTDTQGFDYFAYKGARNLFTKHRVDMLMFELSPREMKKQDVSVEMFFDLIQKEYGFHTCFDLNPQCLGCNATSTPIVRSNFSTDSFIQFVKRESKKDYWLGWWDDIACVNSKKF